MSLVCRILGHKLAVISFPPQRPDSLILICLRCGEHVIIRRLDDDYYLEDLEDDEAEEPRIPQLPATLSDYIR